MSRPRRGRPGAQPGAPWSRERLLALVVAGGVTVLLLLAGLVLALASSLRPLPEPAAPPAAERGSDAAASDSRRDAIAAAPMRSVPREAAFQAPPALTPAPAFLVPEPGVGRGPAGVPTGFPHTPAGAVGQLAATDRLVLEQMSLATAREVHAAWALPGAVRFEDWLLARHVQSFLSNAGQGTTKSASTVVEVAPFAAQVKGVDGHDWVLACVLYDVRATIRATSRMGYGHCERLQWADWRWQIAPGPGPAPAPSAWPGSEIANEAGWLTWTPSP